MDRGLVCSRVLYLHWLTQAMLFTSSLGVLVPRSAGSGAPLLSRFCSDTCLPACLLAFLAFLALLVLWTLHPLPPNIYPSILLPSPSPPISTNTPSGPKSLPVALRSTKFPSQFPFICRSRVVRALNIDVSLCPFALLRFSSLLPSSRYHCLVSIPRRPLPFSSLFITIKQDSSPYPYPSH